MTQMVLQPESLNLIVVNRLFQSHLFGSPIPDQLAEYGKRTGNFQNRSVALADIIIWVNMIVPVMVIGVNPEHSYPLWSTGVCMHLFTNCFVIDGIPVIRQYGMVQSRADAHDRLI